MEMSPSIGLEMAAVYHALGSRVTVVELLPQLLAGTDRDLVKPLQKIAEARQRRDILLARRRLAMAQQSLADLVHGGRSEHGRTVERIEDRILTDETAAEVIAELQGDAWEARLKKTEADPEAIIEEELARLKQKLSCSG